MKLNNPSFSNGRARLRVGIFLLAVLSFQKCVSAALVSSGSGGLIYTPYANEGQANAVNTVPDFSRAGYQGGGVAIPFVPAAVTISNGPGDDTALIQDAIDTVAALPVGADGFRGAVLLRAGDYTVASTLHINADGIVIRGEGQQANDGTRITFTATTQSDLFFFNGSSGPASEGSDQGITDAYVPVGSKAITIADASAYAAGDLIRVTNLMNQQWIDDIGMTVPPLAGGSDDPAWTPSGFQLEHLRYVVAVSGNELTLDAPIVQAIETQYGGGKVERMRYTGALENVGIENIRLESLYAGDSDEDHGWVAIKMHRVVNGWVRQVTSRYFGMGLFSADDSSMFITVQDSACLDPKSQTTGGRKYSFQIDDSTYNLVQRCLARGGRHDYVSGSLTPGPNVFVDSLATAASNDIGPHFRYATGEVYDNIKSNNDINVQNRLNSGTSHGWSGAQVMFWNVEANNIRCDAPTGAMNWSVGAVGNKAEGNFGAVSAAEPFGIWESEGAHVTPRSLYYAQLEERLGADALHEVILPQQQQGPIWAALESWGGDGLLLDPVVCAVDAGGLVGMNVPVQIRARIRDLMMQDNLVSVAWSQLSGPGTVTFGDSALVETTASFSASGQYELQLLASDGNRQVTGNLLINVIDQDDNSAPLVPTGLDATPGYNFVSLDWDDNAEVDLLAYAVYRSETSGDDGSPLAVGVSGSGYVDATAVNGTTYFYRVTASDVNGNESGKSDEVSATPLDNDPPPIVSFNMPTDGEQIFLGESIHVQVEASDLDGTVSNVKLYLDGQFIRQENFAPYDWTDAALQNLAVGSYELEAVATDDDAQTTSLTITIQIVSNEAPPTPGEVTDFGTDVDKVTVGTAGFATTAPASGSETHVADAYRISNGAATSHENFAFLQDFPGMAGTNRNDFSITMQARLFSKGTADKNTYRYGVALFNDTGDLLNTGIDALLHYDDAELQMILRNGLDGANLAFDVFKTVGGSGPYDYPEGETYTFEVIGRYAGDDLELAFTLSDGTTTKTITATLEATQYVGTLFGGTARIRNEFTVDFDTFLMVTEGVDIPLNVAVATTDNSFIRYDVGVQDASETLVVKRPDWGFPNVRVAYLRFPVGADAIGGIAAADLDAVALELFVTNNEPSDTLYVYGLLDSAQFAASSLTETNWTGGVDGTLAGGHNLQGTNRPDGERALPNDLSTVLLGSFTFAAGADTGLKQVVFSDLPAFRTLIEEDTNGEITLMIRGLRNGLTNEIASLFNTSGNPVPTLAVSGEAPPPPDYTESEAWRYQYFGQTTNDGDAADDYDFDGDGLENLLERAFGTVPNDSGGTVPLPDGDVFDDEGTDYPGITYRRLVGGTGTTGVDYTISGLTYTVQYDIDLVDPWNEGLVTQVGSAVDNGDGTETVTVRLTSAVTSQTQQFLRLKVTAAP